MGEKKDKNNSTKVDIYEAIKEIQRGLKHLSLALKEEKTRENVKEKKIQRRHIQLGDKVHITNNIRKGQEREGEVVKINEESGFITVSGKNNSGNTQRLRKNLRRIDSYSK